METRHLSNIFDPVQRELDQTVFKGETPRPSVVSFIKRKFYEKMRESGISEPELFLDLVLTGSLTTYQYSDTSDADVSVIADYEGLMQELALPSPGEVRRHLVRTATSSLDGTFLPGTRHPLQYFVNPPNDDLAERYKPGVRSGYHLQRGEWLNPPEKERSHDVQTELPELYSRAEQMADKMRMLLDGEHLGEAKELFQMIHVKRGLDENEGLGDFSEGNIVYKYLLHEGIFDRLKGIGVHIATYDRSDPAEQDKWREYMEQVDIHRPYCEICGEGPYATPELMAMHMESVHQRTASWEPWELEEMRNSFKAMIQFEIDNPEPDEKGRAWQAKKIKEMQEELDKLQGPATWPEKPVDKYAAEHKTYKVIYDYERDRIILSENLPDDHVVEANHVIVGGYDGENVNLDAESKQWLNANYLKRLWMHTYPGKTLSNVYINDTHVPTRDKDFMTYVDKNPAVVNNPEVFRHVTADRWRKGKDWKDFIKNKGIVVEFKIGSDETFDGRVKEIEKEYVKVEVSPGEIRKLENELLKSMKFRVRDDKKHVSATAADQKMHDALATYGYEGCFGYIGGQLLIGYKHHQEIMGALFEAGWTWEDMFTQPQCWGWYEVAADNYDWEYGDKDPTSKGSQIDISFASDSGKQTQAMRSKARQAFRNLFGIQSISDYFDGGVSKEQYGQGLRRDRTRAEKPGYGAGVKGTIPPPPSQTPPAAV